MLVISGSDGNLSQQFFLTGEPWVWKLHILLLLSLCFPCSHLAGVQKDLLPLVHLQLMAPTRRQMPFLEMGSCREEVECLVKGVTTWRLPMLGPELGK